MGYVFKNEATEIKEAREDERKKTINEVLSFSRELGFHITCEAYYNSLEAKFCTPDPVEELAKELYEANAKGNGWGWETTSSKGAYLEQAKHLLDNYELKKKS